MRIMEFSDSFDQSCYDEIFHSLESENKLKKRIKNQNFNEFAKRINNKVRLVYVCECNRFLQRFVFYPNNDMWYFWNLFILPFCLIESMGYPYFTA